LESFPPPIYPDRKPSIYTGDVRNRKHQFLRKGRVKALPCTILGSRPALSNGVHITTIILMDSAEKSIRNG
jgi:hypothetical protein